jgi:hypothetical protein
MLLTSFLVCAFFAGVGYGYGVLRGRKRGYDLGYWRGRRDGALMTPVELTVIRSKTHNPN